MLKTLRVMSFGAVVLMICVVVFITASCLKDNPEIQAFLQRSSIIERIGAGVDGAGLVEGATPELVVQAHLFALRIDPPAPPVIPKRILKNEDSTNKGGRGSTNGEDNPPPPPPTTRFNLLATVLYESSPEKSLALFETGDKQQWFRMGETVDRYQIHEIKDGRVLLAQPDRKLEEIYVPPKRHLASLLRDS